MNVTFSATFEAATLTEAQEKALSLYKKFMGETGDDVTLPHSAAVRVINGTAEFSCNTRVEY